MDDARLRQLGADLRADREDLDRIIAEATRCLDDLVQRQPTYLELRGAGDIIHDFYNAVEHFFERVAVEMNGGLPRGADSHAQILRRMSHGVPERLQTLPYSRSLASSGPTLRLSSSMRFSSTT